MALSSCSLMFGLAPHVGVDALATAASAAVLGRPTDVHLALWHGLTPALGLSALTLATGLSLYAVRGLLRTIATRWGGAMPWGPAAWYDWGMSGLNAIAAAQTRFLQS